MINTIIYWAVCILYHILYCHHNMHSPAHFCQINYLPPSLICNKTYIQSVYNTRSIPLVCISYRIVSYRIAHRSGILASGDMSPHSSQSRILLFIRSLIFELAEQRYARDGKNNYQCLPWMCTWVIPRPYILYHVIYRHKPPSSIWPSSIWFIVKWFVSHLLFGNNGIRLNTTISAQQQ